MPQLVAFALDDPVYSVQIDTLCRVKIHALTAIARSRAMLHLKTLLSLGISRHPFQI
jgi:hypothetical protein